VASAPAAQRSEQSTADRSKERHLAGHSQFGEAYDEGPREKPAKIAGIGSTHFPITTKNPEVQMWFDQGNTLLHSFWYYEAERAFRWASKLEPDNPMPYCGLVRSVGGGARARAIIAVSQDRPEHNAKSQEMAPLKMKIASDADYANAKRFKSYDDFEEIGIHSTILIDKDGRVYWAKHGGAPFDDYKFITSQLQRMNEKSWTAKNTTTAQ
jgi:hypothetical protein